MKFTFYGHACFSVEMNGKTLLFDPFISPNPQAAAIDIAQLKPDYILLSHGHEDHMADALQIAQQSGASLISNYEIISWYAVKHGYENGHPMNHGGKANFDFGTVKYVNAVHSSVLPDGTYGGNPGGFVIWDKENCFYYAGDTALCVDMQLIPTTCPELDFCVLPIGDNFTMGPEDALIAADFVECDIVVGVHYDTFGFIEIDKEKAVKFYSDHEKTLHLPAIGETIEL